MDAITIDHVLAELGPRLVGRHIARLRLATADAMALEVSGSRARYLWIDAGRGTAGVYEVTREAERRLRAPRDAAVPGRARQAVLHLRKHLAGARLTGLVRVAGERTIRLETSGGTLVLRLSGPAPALTLVRDGAPLATVGDGPEAWPPPPEAPEREWSRLDPAAFEADVAASRSAGRSLPRSVLAACPGLGPALARETDGSASSFAALVVRLRSPRPTLLAPGPRETWQEADLAEAGRLVLVPIPIERPSATLLHPESWLEAGGIFLEARRRGIAFEQRRRGALAETRRRLRRLEQLETNLRRDEEALADESSLRREAEALLALGHRLEPGSSEVSVPDPYEPGRSINVAVDPRFGGVQNAQRRFEKARRSARARHQIALRLRETRSSLDAERRREACLLEARDAGALAPHAPEEDSASGAPADASASPRRYLTSRGLVILVGRSARENQHLTFRLARPEDLWFHARDVPGSHVILRDDQGRAGAEDLREAAEVAAFFSEARSEAKADVHATRRKHVRPARGGPGRVFVAHSETLRVNPRDPEGRLRRR